MASQSFTIETENLSRRFGGVRAVSDISLQVPKGSVFGFLGPNGSGKTTTLRMLLGLIRPSRGRISVNGHNIRRNRRAALTGVGAIVEQPALYPSMTGRQTLQMASTLAASPKEQIAELLDVVGLTHAADRLVKGYSLGMKQRLALARTLVGQPRLLILDEPTNGLDPSGIAEMRQLIKSLPERFGTTVLLSSHLLAEVEQMADHVGLIRKGELVFQGSLRELKSSAGSALYIGSDRPDDVLAALKAEGLEGEKTEKFVRARCEWDDVRRAAFLRSLVEKGIAVTHYEWRQAMLEDVFLDLTSETSGEGAS